MTPSTPTPSSHDSELTEPAPHSRLGRPMLRLYQWVLHWAETPYGTPALFVISLAESSFFPIPPDVLQLALSFSRPARSFFYALVSAAGSVVGAAIGWMIGFAFWVTVDDFFYRFIPGVTPESVDYVGQRYDENAFLVILGAAFTPIPFKVFTIAAGVFHQYVSLSTLLIASALGRSARFFLLAATVRLFGPAMRRVIERHFELVTFALFGLLVAGFVAIKYLF